MYDWYVGQEVVCINNTPLPGANTNMNGLTVGSVYHISWVGISISPNTQQEYVGLRLQEIFRKRVNISDAYNLPFDAERFRPVQKKTTDISIFKKMERPTKVQQPEKV